MSAAELLDRARDGSARALGRLLSAVEAASPAQREIAAAAAPYAGRAQIVGITGAPGVGKSTSTSMLVTSLRAAGKRVAVLAVDPSSPFSGGALLGDRVRMQEHATDPGVFIRSMASRGHLGGLAEAAPQAIRVLDAAGFDLVLVETVGVGQAEVDIASAAETTLVLLAPGMGDGIQAAKAGILEIADIFVVNKADRDGADATVKHLRHMLGLGGKHSDAGTWRPSIVKTVATTADGVTDVLAAIDKHRDWLQGSGELDRRRLARAATEVEAITVGLLRAQIADVHGGLAAAAKRVVAGETDPYTAADELIASVGSTT